MISFHDCSRRQFLRGVAAGPFVAAASPVAGHLSAAQLKRPKIRDVQAMMLQGPGRTYTLVRITTDSGHSGVAEAYGSPGVGVKEQVLSLKPWLVGKDPLEIDALYMQMGEGTPSLSGTRTDGSAHNLMRAVSGIEMALWDLAGKILAVPTHTLLGGRFRDKVRVYHHAAPKNMLDKAAVADWAAKAKAHSSGFTCHKFGFAESDPATDRARDPSNRVLTTKEPGGGSLEPSIVIPRVSSSWPLVGNDVLPFARIRARDDGYDWLGVAGVEDFMRHARLDEDEVAGGILDGLLQSLAVLVPDAARENVEHDLEADMDVRVGDTARRNRRHVHRQRLGADVVARQAHLVVDAVPVAAVLSGANDEDAAMPLNRGTRVCGVAHFERSFSIQSR